MAQTGPRGDILPGYRGDPEYVARDSPEFQQAWNQELATVASDEVMQAVARAASLDDVMARYGYPATAPTGAGAPKVSTSAWNPRSTTRPRARSRPWSSGRSMSSGTSTSSSTMRPGRTVAIGSRR